VETKEFIIDFSDKENISLNTLDFSKSMKLSRIDSSFLTISKLKNLKETNKFKIDFSNRKNKKFEIDKKYYYKDTITTESVPAATIGL